MFILPNFIKLKLGNIILINEIKVAINEIPASAYSITNPPLTDTGINTGYTRDFSFPERNFVSDLKSNLVKRIDFNESNLKVHIDIYKNIKNRDFDNNSFKATEALLPSKAGIFPDLIIHEDQSNQNNQKLALECKLAPGLSYDDFCKDLFKLMIYKEEFKFQFLYYLIVNNSFSDIHSHYQSYIKEYYINNENLHILVKENYESEIKCIIHSNGTCEKQ